MSTNTALSTFLSTSSSGAPATTAWALLSQLKAVQYTFNSNTRYKIDEVAGAALVSSQSQFSGLITQDPYQYIDASFAVLIQALQDYVNLNLPVYKTIVTTDNTGSYTLDMTAYGFKNVPVVALTPVTAVTGYATNAEITSINKTTLVIKSNRTQLISLINTPTFTNVSTQVHVVICSLG